MFRSPCIALYALAGLATLPACSSAPQVSSGPPTVAEAPAPQDLGEFTAHQDIGSVKIPGGLQFDKTTGIYTLSGSGTNMWAGQDEFHFVWKRLKGDFIVRARMAFEGEGDPNRKIGWTVRKSLAPDSMHVNASLHGNGLIALQYRGAQGAETLQEIPELKSPDIVQLERRGTTYVLSTAKFGQPFVTAEVRDLDLGDEPYVGLSACAHNPEALARATFRNVRIVRPAAPDFRPYQDYIGSNLELMDIETGSRKIIYRDPDSIQAPNWLHDGKKLLFNRKGHLYTYELDSGAVAELETGFATNNNNDHVLSWDGKQLAISHHAEDDGRQSTAYVLPLTGSATPRQITKKGGGHSFLHGFSPDDQSLIFTGERGGQFDIWRVELDSGVETQLTNLKTLDDGSEFSADGKHIYFNSTRTGSMELWRMAANGSEPTQLTDDEFNNWFPHVSPDGKSLVFLSFQKDVNPAEHPFYRHVYLRTMPIGGGTPKVVAYLYGGQGTINVPSWSPDGKHIAFVSNTQLDE